MSKIKFQTKFRPNGDSHIEIETGSGDRVHVIFPKNSAAYELVQLAWLYADELPSSRYKAEFIGMQECLQHSPPGPWTCGSDPADIVRIYDAVGRRVADVGSKDFRPVNEWARKVADVHEEVRAALLATRHLYEVDLVAADGTEYVADRGAEKVVERYGPFRMSEVGLINEHGAMLADLLLDVDPATEEAIVANPRDMRRQRISKRSWQDEAGVIPATCWLSAKRAGLRINHYLAQLEAGEIQRRGLA